jgi:hypothetical protein
LVKKRLDIYEKKQSMSLTSREGENERKERMKRILYRIENE